MNFLHVLKRERNKPHCVIEKGLSVIYEKKAHSEGIQKRKHKISGTTMWLMWQ
jgi:hypothetical protein